MCFFCKCDKTKNSLTAFTATFEERVVVVKNVPCEECKQCGEKYFSNATMEALEKIVSAARKTQSEVFITEFSAQAA